MAAGERGRWVLKNKMRPWYKYLPLEYANGLVDKGKIKLGTLFEYKNEDLYGPDIGDKGEGTLTEWSRIDKENVTQSDLNRIEGKVFKVANGVKGVKLNCLVAVSQKSSNLYVFSSSKVFNVELMRKLSADYHKKYDACVKITNPKKFIKVVSSAIKEIGKFETYEPCCYMHRTKHHSKMAPHPVFIKEPRYQYQEEVRAVWSSIRKEGLQSQFLELPKLTKYCELYYIDSGESTEDGIAKIFEKQFSNDVVKIDSSAYVNCIFKDTEILFCAEDTIHLDTCEFHNCQWYFGGAAERTLNFMKCIYHNFGGDGKKIIEDIFKNIKLKNDNGVQQIHNRDRNPHR